jgi:hypothetical protein
MKAPRKKRVPSLVRQDRILRLLRSIVQSLNRIEKQLERVARVREVELELWSRTP